MSNPTYSPCSWCKGEVSLITNPYDGLALVQCTKCGATADVTSCDKCRRFDILLKKKSSKCCGTCRSGSNFKKTFSDEEAVGDDPDIKAYLKRSRRR